MSRLQLALLALALPVVVAGCGLESDDKNAPEPRAPARTVTEPEPAPQPTGPVRPRAGLPQPTQGLVEINGEEKGSLTSRAVEGFTAGGVREAHDGASEALNQLCQGEIDIADSARPISFREFQACLRNGLELKTFRVASDAVVVAIRNETDIGADCLTLSQVDRIFEAGSSVNNWQDVSPDYFNVPLRATGPDENANAFDYFAQRVLGVTDDATLDDFRSDYLPHPTDTGTKATVVGERRTDLDRFVSDLNRRRQAFDVRIQAFFERIVPLDRRIKTLDRRIRELDTIIGAGVDPEERGLKRTRDRLARQRAALARRRKALDLDRRRTDRRKRELVRRLVPLARAGILRDRRRRGVVGLFRFSFYEQYEQQLRPFEIEDDEGNLRCIFPSQATITAGTYPLARSLLLITTQRSLARPEVKRFLRSYIDRSQDYAEADRLVPLPDPDKAKELEKVGGAPTQPTPQAGGNQQQGTTTTPQSQNQGGSTATPELPSSDDGPSYRQEGGGSP